MMTGMTITILFGVFGLLFGSFAGATVWRLRSRQLLQDAEAGENISAVEKKQVRFLAEKRSISDDRSRCLQCGHELAWYDLIPLVSWLARKGKCHYCKKHIGWFEPLIEIGVAVFFVVSWLFWPYGLDTGFEALRFMLWLAAGIGLAILFAYDAKWFLLPDRVSFTVIALGVLTALLVAWEQNFTVDIIMSIAGAVLLLSGFYLAIYILSKGAWIGFGDVKLGLGLALLLADWQLAILAFFMANLIGTLILLPLMLIGKVKRGSHIPFGPMLIAGWFIAGIFGHQIIGWYLSIALGVS